MAARVGGKKAQDVGGIDGIDVMVVGCRGGTRRVVEVEEEPNARSTRMD
jgi:hypothetical protein